MNQASTAMDSSWHEVQLFLIPKVKEPINLQPIALLHPGNKLLAAKLATRLQGKVADFLAEVPQWAYLRSTGDALMAVCAHMHQVRTLISSHSRSLPDKFHGATQPKMLGGISIMQSGH